MTRLRLVLTIFLLLGGAFGPVALDAQPAAKIARVGWLARAEVNIATRDAFLEGLRDLGYIEGRNVVIEYRDAAGKLERLPALAAELVAAKVDVIVAPSTAAALAAKQSTSTVPIVSMSVPVPSTLAASLAQPGGNVTGLAFFSPELAGKRLEQLTQAVPGLRQVAVLWQPGGQGERTEREMLKQVDDAARALAIRLQFVEARGPADIGRAFSDMSRARADALTVLPSNMFFSEHKRLVDMAAKHRLPAIYPWREFVDAGGLVSYGVNVADVHRRAAVYVDKILKGAKPANLPIEQPTKFELLVNLKTAKALGLTIPQSVLARADQVIDK